MKLIDFFASHVKPYTLRGKKILNPSLTGLIDTGISCIKEYDVNFWLYTKGKTTVAIDSGYKNYPDINDALTKIDINSEQVNAVFMTHADVDHGGGMDKNSKKVFPRAQIYLGEEEEGYVTNSSHRFKFACIKINNTIEFDKGYKTLKDNEFVQINDIKIEAIHIPGHTKGHMCYIVDDKFLFSGDCLAINKKGGYCFFDFFNLNTQQNIKSLHKLKNIISNRDIKMICTGHNGFTYDIDNCFKYIDVVAASSRKHPFDPDAPYDIFKNS